MLEPDKPEGGPARWAEMLRAPFPPDQVFAKPRVWCANCRKAASKVCSLHRKEQCQICHQYITKAHIHLDYVGHADVTSRLLDVDPYWRWEPAYTEVDKEILLAAVQTGQAAIVEQVIRNAPPLLDRDGGMWMTLIVHDGQGREIRTLCYGDAQDKGGPDAMKERIGDGVRNGALRRGVALDLWSKTDRALGVPVTEEQIAEETRKRQAKRGGSVPDATGEPGADKKAEEPAATINPEVGALAELAWAMRGRDDTTLEMLQKQVYDVARKNRGWLASPCIHPSGSGELVTLTQVIHQVKTELMAAGRK